MGEAERDNLRWGQRSKPAKVGQQNSAAYSLVGILVDNMSKPDFVHNQYVQHFQSSSFETKSAGHYYKLAGQIQSKYFEMTFLKHD